MILPASNAETDVHSMNFALPTFRAFVTTALVVNVTFASVTPATCNASSLGTVATSCVKLPPASPNANCCGKVNCSCGMLCCNSQTPDRPEPAAPVRRDDTQSLTWLVSLDSGDFSHAALSTDNWAAAIGTRPVPSDWCSLVVLHVQLNT
jgi:hypothetical protein